MTNQVDAAARARSLSLWSGEIDIAPLTGGLSNESYTVVSGGEKYVVRIGADLPFHHVFKDHELMVARAAHAAGFSPEVVFAEPGVMVSRFIDGVTFDAAAVQTHIHALADFIRQFHQQMPLGVSGGARLFWPFHVIRDYAQTLTRAESHHAALLPVLLGMADALEKLQQPMHFIFGHHDLLPANFIHDGDRLWLIDFEYAAFSTPMFDIAGVLAHGNVGADASAYFMSRYFDRACTDDEVRAMCAMQGAALLREAMWSMVSESFMSAPGVDYAEYTQENMTALKIAADGLSERFGIELPTL